MPSLVSLADAHQDRLLARADRSADAAERAVRLVWIAVLAALKAGGPPHVVHAAVRHALRSLPGAVNEVRGELAGVARDSARWTAITLADKMTRRQRLRLFEKDEGWWNRKKKKGRSQSLYQIVRDHGGIDPNDSSFRASFRDVSEAREVGIKFGVFKNGGAGLDELAEELVELGHIVIPEDHHPGEWLLQELARDAQSRHVSHDEQHEDALNEYYRDYEAAAGDHGQSEIEAALRFGEEAGVLEAQARGVEGTGGGDVFGDASEEGIDDSAITFDFGGFDPPDPPKLIAAASMPDPSDRLVIGAILPPITAEQVNAVLYASGWENRIQSLTRLVSADVLAGRVAMLATQGATIQTIASEIRPALQGVQAAARRTARTAGLYVAHEAELATYERLGDMVEGYQIHAVLDHATRPEHRRRDGQKFYREPRAGHKGFDQMPRPPREADGSWAFNCRCFLSPILA